MNDLAELLRELPDDYEASSKSSGALLRKRGVLSAGNLLLLCLFHLLNGCSLLEVGLISKLAKFGSMSDVAFMKRFEKCAEWFRQISERLIGAIQIKSQKPASLTDYRILAIDGSVVTEKGKSKREYMLHYALDVFSMGTAIYKITTQKTGESLLNFDLKPKDLAIVDRAYISRAGIEHCIKSGADCIIRYRKNSFKVYDSENNEVNLLKELAPLKHEEEKEFNVYMRNSKGAIVPIRMCAKKKDEEAVNDTEKRLKKQSIKQQCEMSDDTKAFNNYIVVVTTLPDTVTCHEVLETYRFRWQVEIYFKRLKSLLDFGQLPKRREESIIAWLNGKMMLALLIEKSIASKAFSP